MMQSLAHKVTRQTPEALTVMRCAWMGMKEESCPAADLRSGQFSRRPSTVLLISWAAFSSMLIAMNFCMKAAAPLLSSALPPTGWECVSCASKAAP